MARYNDNKDVPVLRGRKIIVGEMPLPLALKKFKQRVDDSGVLEEVKKRMTFEKPTVERKRRKAAARARWQKKLRDQQFPKIDY
jgi:small subunit ribosomal protein S21